MKYLKTFEAKAKTNVERKMELLKMLSLHLSDEGIKVEVYNGPFHWYDEDMSCSFDGNYIHLAIKDKEHILSRPITESDEIKELDEIFKSHGMKNRGYSAGDDFIVYRFDKFGKWTDSESWKNF